MEFLVQEILVAIAVVFAIIGNVPYLADVLKRKVRPHPYTWFVWSIVSLTTFFGGFAKGAGVGAIPTGVAECFTILIFFFSLRYGFSNIQKRDHVFLAIALFGLIPWAITRDPTISVIIVVSIDVVAFMPTLYKTWQYPKTENRILFIMNVARHLLTLLSLQAYNIATALHSIAMIITNTVMVWFISRKKIT